jgi:hypothetical protein
MPELVAEFGCFLWSVLRHWICISGSALVGFYQFGYPAIFGKEPPVTGWWVSVIFWGFLGLALFLAWRDEHKKAKGRPRRALAITIADEFCRVKGPGEPQFGWIPLLIHHSQDFGDHRDLDWVCRELEQRGHGNPFDYFLLQYTRRSFTTKKRFKFVNDARIERAGSDRIISDMDASNYISSVWAEQNRLKERPEMRQRIVVSRVIDKWTEKIRK